MRAVVVYLHNVGISNLIVIELGQWFKVVIYFIFSKHKNNKTSSSAWQVHLDNLYHLPKFEVINTLSDRLSFSLSFVKLIYLMFFSSILIVIENITDFMIIFLISSFQRESKDDFMFEWFRIAINFYYNHNLIWVWYIYNKNELDGLLLTKSSSAFLFLMGSPFFVMLPCKQ